MQSRLPNYLATINMSQFELSKKSKVSQSVISRYVSGKTDITKRNIDKILKALDAKYEDVFR